MSLKNELEILAEACHTCVEQDESSIDDHLTKCNSCQDYQKKAEQLSQMVQTLEMMAAKPEEDRHNILNARMVGFGKLEEGKRKTAISDMLDGLSELKEKDRLKIVKTRTNILTKMPKNDRKVLLGSLSNVMQTWDMDRKQMEQRAVMAATEDYFLLKKIMVRKMFKKVISGN